MRLNDNLLRRTSLPEIRAVMAHELGHYVMNHVYKAIAQLALLFLGGFLFAQWAMDHLLARHGARLGLRGVADVASLPLLAAVFSLFMFLATPIMNTLIRTQEIEADRFGAEPGARAARRGRGRPEADRIPQARPRADRGIHLLRPPEHAVPRPRRDALARGDGHALTPNVRGPRPGA